mgnify:CR=1 FL=1
MRANDGTRTGGEILIGQLVVHGVQHVFCVPGESYLAALDAFYDRPIKLTVCRHDDRLQAPPLACPGAHARRASRARRRPVRGQQSCVAPIRATLFARARSSSTISSGLHLSDPQATRLLLFSAGDSS